MFYLSIVAKSRSELDWCVFAHTSFIAVTQLLPANTWAAFLTVTVYGLGK